MAYNDNFAVSLLCLRCDVTTALAVMDSLKEVNIVLFLFQLLCPL